MTVPPSLNESIHAALLDAVTDDQPSLIERLGDIAGWGPRGIFPALWGWSAITLMGLTGDAQPDRASFYELEVSDVHSGQVTGVGAVGHPAGQQALQMITLYANGDSETAIAIIHTAFDHDCAAGLLLSSVRLAAATARAHMEEHDRNCGGCGLDGAS